MQTVADEAIPQLAGPVAQVVAPLVATVRTLVPEQSEHTVEVVHEEQLVTVQLVVVVAAQAPETRLYPVIQAVGVKVDPLMVPWAQLVHEVGMAVQAEALA